MVEVHFQNLFKDDDSSDFLSNIPCVVNERENDELMKPFYEQEIIDVIWSMESSSMAWWLLLSFLPSLLDSY